MALQQYHYHYQQRRRIRRRSSPTTPLVGSMFHRSMIFFCSSFLLFLFLSSSKWYPAESFVLHHHYHHHQRRREKLPTRTTTRSTDYDTMTTKIMNMRPPLPKTRMTRKDTSPRRTTNNKNGIEEKEEENKKLRNRNKNWSSVVGLAMALGFGLSVAASAAPPITTMTAAATTTTTTTATEVSTTTTKSDHDISNMRTSPMTIATTATTATTADATQSQTLGEKQPQKQQQEATTTATTTTTATATATTTTSRPEKLRRYWDIMRGGSLDQIRQTNEALLDWVVGSIVNLYYDNSGGAFWQPTDIFDRWKELKDYNKKNILMKSNNNNNNKEHLFSPTTKQQATTSSGRSSSSSSSSKDMPLYVFDSRENAVQGIKWLVSTLNDPFSKYLTREEMRDELLRRDDGFMGLGAVVEAPTVQGNFFFDGKRMERSISTTTSIVSSNSYNYDWPSNNNNNNNNNNNMDKNNNGIPSSSSLSNSPPKNGNDDLQYLQQHQKKSFKSTHRNNNNHFLSLNRVANLPVVTAIVADSPAERGGIVVGDRIVAVGTDTFLGMHSAKDVDRKLNTKYHAENYLGYPDLTIAKAVVRGPQQQQPQQQPGVDGAFQYDNLPRQQQEEYDTRRSSNTERVVGYRLSRVRLPTASIEPFTPGMAQQSTATSTSSSSTTTTSPGTPSIVSGGDKTVHYELLTPSRSIFERSIDDYFDYNRNNNNVGSGTSSTTTTAAAAAAAPAPPTTTAALENNNYNNNNKKVGYIRITRFSRTSTTDGFVKAVQELEAAGAQSYILDLRNNFGGIIQEAMLIASTLLRDPHAVLCYTLNSRGGFTPHDAEEFIVDKRYPGYLLSTEAPNVAYNQVRRDNPTYTENGGIDWVPPSAYASLHEQRLKRHLTRISWEDQWNLRQGIIPSSFSSTATSSSNSNNNNNNNNNNNIMKQQQQYGEILVRQLQAQKKLVILINEGTASSAEVLASALHDNGRTVALVGVKTYGKGLIQHTIPTPDGGGLRMTVAEYLTPALQHVTKVGGARFDPHTGELVGGGIRPDIYCPSNQGIPSNVGADLCVGVALDAIEEAEQQEQQQQLLSSSSNSHNHGVEGGYGTRRRVQVGIVKDDI